MRHDPAGSRLLRLREGEVVGEINLNNMFRTYLETPRGERRQYIKLCARSALAPLRELPGDFESARPDLRPKFWTRGMDEQLRLRARLGEPAPRDVAFEPIGAHLLATLAFDWPEAIQSIVEEDLRRWGVTF